MKKQKERFNANDIGASALSDPHFKEHAKNTPRDNLNPNSNISLLTSNHRGITLIALIITIIVMLILVGVTINLAIQGGLFGKARKAATKTQIEIDREALLQSVVGAIGENGEINFEELDKEGALPEGFEGRNGIYISKAGNTFYVDENGNITTEGKWKLSKDGNSVTRGDVTLQIGDYVNYTPKTETTTYSKDKLGEKYTGSTSNKSDLTTKTLKWRVLGADANGCLTLISYGSIGGAFYFSSATGYNNGVYILNDICKTLYSNNDLGITARNLTIEDIEGGFNEIGIQKRNEYTSDTTLYGKTKTYANYLDYPVIYAQENGSGIGVAEADVESKLKRDGIGRSELYYNETQITNKQEGKEKDTATGNLTCTQNYYGWKSTPSTYFKNETFYNMVFTGHFWLASRCVDCGSSYANFGLCRIWDKDLAGKWLLYIKGDGYTSDSTIRPVVSLGSNVKVTKCNDEANGVDIEHMHSLSKVD